MLAQGRNAKEVKFNQLRSKVTDLTAVLKELQAKNEHVASKTSEQVGAVDLHLTLVSLSLNAFSSWTNYKALLPKLKAFILLGFNLEAMAYSWQARNISSQVKFLGILRENIYLSCSTSVFVDQFEQQISRLENLIRELMSKASTEMAELDSYIEEKVAEFYEKSDDLQQRVGLDSATILVWVLRRLQD